MAENSKIEWTDHTFNPWMGCTKVSPGCAHCYAEREMDKHWGKVKWGPQGTRVRTSEAYWKKPLQWNITWWVICAVCGWRGVYNEYGSCPDCEHPMVATMKRTRQRVFCASLADVFEDKPDTFIGAWRALLFDLIEKTTNLDWLLLTKRPENIETMMPIAWIGGFPKNVWIGISAENQKEFDARIPILESIGRRYRPTVTFVSAEPLLSAIDMNGWLVEEDLGDEDASCWSSPIDWVICGGESGPEARPMNPMWARELRDECQAAGVPFFFKQWGEWMPSQAKPVVGEYTCGGIFLKSDSQFGNQGDWWNGQATAMDKVGKKKAGRLLDGYEWNEIPKGDDVR